jgi:hypothetical protein
MRGTRPLQLTCAAHRADAAAIERRIADPRAGLPHNNSDLDASVEVPLVRMRFDASVALTECIVASLSLSRLAALALAYALPLQRLDQH